MKIGISLKIDVTKIDKSRIFEGAKGKYIDLTTFIDTDNPSQYGDHGFISQSVSKQEKEQGIQTPIIGNAKVFYNPPQNNQGQQGGYQQQSQGYRPPPETQGQNQYQGQQGQDQQPKGDCPF